MDEKQIMGLIKKGEVVLRFDVRTDGSGYGIWFENGVYLRLITQGENQWGVEIHPRG